jgi:hypothetical protein
MSEAAINEAANVMIASINAMDEKTKKIIKDELCTPNSTSGTDSAASAPESTVPEPAEAGVSTDKSKPSEEPNPSSEIDPEVQRLQKVNEYDEKISKLKEELSKIEDNTSEEYKQKEEEIKSAEAELGNLKGGRRRSRRRNYKKSAKKSAKRGGRKSTKKGGKKHRKSAKKGGRKRSYRKH